jgi:hypothetical protein
VNIGDRCTETYYPSWSSRGIRGVDCSRPAKAMLTEPGGWTTRRLCGIHANRYARLGAPWIVERDDD